MSLGYELVVFRKFIKFIREEDKIPQGLKPVFLGEQFRHD